MALIWEEQQQWPLASGGTGNGRQMNNGSKRPLDWELCRWPQDVCRSWPLESRDLAAEARRRSTVAVGNAQGK